MMEKNNEINTVNIPPPESKRDENETLREGKPIGFLSDFEDGAGEDGRSLNGIPEAIEKVEGAAAVDFTNSKPMVIDHYSTMRHSDADYKKHNEEVLCTSANDLHKINMSEYNGRRALQCICTAVDKNQVGSTKRLEERVYEVQRWKTEVYRSIEAMSEEIVQLEDCKNRATKAHSALALVKSISDECLSRRSFRDGHDLAQDKTEEELLKEAALINEVGGLLERTINQIKEQLHRNKDMKSRLDGDWSDKQETLSIDSYNVILNNRSDAIMFRPAATRLPEGQLSGEGWEAVMRELLASAEVLRGQSCELRVLMDGPILSECIRDLKAQADKVDIALARGIAEIQQCLKAMFNELDIVVRRNADSDKLILDLQYGIRGLDKATKVVQTRLDYRLQRPKNENAMDKAQLGLINEARALSEQTAAMKFQLKEAESCLNALVKSRGCLEKELQNKLKTLYIDKERCQVMRARYPSATVLSGH